MVLASRERRLPFTDIFLKELADFICQDLLVPSLLRAGTTFAASSLAMVPGTPIPPMLARYVHV
jgi:hypothetical protein